MFSVKTVGTNKHYYTQVPNIKRFISIRFTKNTKEKGNPTITLQSVYKNNREVKNALRLKLSDIRELHQFVTTGTGTVYKNDLKLLWVGGTLVITQLKDRPNSIKVNPNEILEFKKVLGSAINILLSNN